MSVAQGRVMVQSGPGGVRWFCPGCEFMHTVPFAPIVPPAKGRPGAPNGWEWNNDLDEPTLSPSVLVQGGSDNIRCHSFIRAGQIEFLSDCTHSLAGQTVPMVPVEAW